MIVVSTLQCVAIPVEKGPLSDYCTFISYDSLMELSKLKHLGYLSDSVLEEYTEVAE